MHERDGPEKVLRSARKFHDATGITMEYLHPHYHLGGDLLHIVANHEVLEQKTRMNLQSLLLFDKAKI